MTAWTEQRDDALAKYSKPYATAGLIDFRAVKEKVLRRVQLEECTKRQALDTLQRRYERIRAEYLRIEGTTYAAWLEFGPTAEWEECLEAAADDAVWNRLVERGLAELR